jgi:hypothetical protein
MPNDKYPPPAASLDDRIAAAFAAAAKSDIFEPLIRDVEIAAKTANEMASAARETSLDPIRPSTEAAQARRELEDQTFKRDRFQAAAKRLSDRHRAVKAAEENARRKIEYDRVTAERDKLAEELARVYPQMAATLAALLQRIDANDHEIATLKPPDGAARLLSAELIARGMPGFVRNGVEALSIITDLRLPAFHFDQHAPYTWPARTTAR